MGLLLQSDVLRCGLETTHTGTVRLIGEEMLINYGFVNRYCCFSYDYFAEEMIMMFIHIGSIQLQRVEMQLFFIIDQFIYVICNRANLILMFSLAFGYAN